MHFVLYETDQFDNRESFKNILGVFHNVKEVISYFLETTYNDEFDENIGDIKSLSDKDMKHNKLLIATLEEFNCSYMVCAYS